MKLLIASDHRGFKLKEHLKKGLSHIEWEDLGCDSEEVVDYPDYADKLIVKLKENQMGVLICGSGQGMAMRANKYPQVRAALCWNKEVASLAREHNDANTLCLGARVLPQALCEEILQTFLNTSFGGGRHKKRVCKIKEKLSC